MIEKAARIRVICERYHVLLNAAALQFILAPPALVSVIPGMQSVAEVEENVRMVELPFPGALWVELK
jgi:D-threo-aldose 1-dehydrogenase